ncbi:MAG: response regulator [Cyanothece sp. SIO1E1]|nr:response regulator [Cyanothece sp. SIO1E1]
MKASQSYILVLDQTSDALYRAADDSHMLQHRLKHLSCSVVIANSPDQAVAQVRQEPPYLVILVSNCQAWLQPLVNQLRGTPYADSSTIVALTDSNVPSWLHQEENPGLDGFLVKPLNSDILKSLVQSAWVRQTCCKVS